MLLILQYSLIIAVLNIWIGILRKPDNLLSFYDKALIGLDEVDPILHKILTCGLCHSGYLAIITIITIGYTPNFSISHLLILPFSMVFYSIINVLLNE